MTRLYNLADRIANRVMRHLPNPALRIADRTPIVSFTFDDVPNTALESGARILEKHGVSGTFYVAGGLVGRREAGLNLISIDGCRELAERGHEIGCHTYSHRNIRPLGAQALTEDLDRNAAFLSQNVRGLRARNFAFPYNLASPLARRTLALRYQTCRGGWQGINRGPTDPGYLKAVAISPNTIEQNRDSRWIDEVADSPGWLIFFTHDVSDRPSPWGCTPEVLERLVSCALERGCVVLPVDQALRRPEVTRTRPTGMRG